MAKRDTLPPGEFSGRIQKNRVQPPPHEPTASEQLMLMYTTGQTEDSTMLPDDGESFRGEER